MKLLIAGLDLAITYGSFMSWLWVVVMVLVILILATGATGNE